MSSSNMQNMMGVRGNGMGLQQRSAMPENSNPNGQIQKIIYQHLQQQPTQPGWWSTVTPQNRSAVVFHIVSSLRLIKPEISIQQAIEVALKFERKAFDDSQDKATYEGACRAKIAEIAETRTKQATILQQRMQNSGGPSMQLLQQQQQQQQQQQNMAMNNAITSMQMQGQLPPGYQVPQQQMQPPHMQMQTTAQQSYPMNNSMANNQPSMQQGQQIQSNPPAQGPPRAGQPQFTPEEHKQIMELARRTAQATPPEEIEMIKQRMERNVDARTRQIWLQQGVEPHHAYFRQFAIKQFMNGKAQMQGTMAQAGGFNSQQSQPITRNPSSNQNQPPAQNNFGQSFPPSIQQNVHQIQGLQEDALRKQDLGREVVPASNSQQQSQQARGFQVTPRQLPIQQPSANRSIPAPNTAQQQNIQAQQIQAARVQAAQTQNAMGPQGQPGQQTPLQGQLGGLSNHPGQGVSQPSPSMPNLNRPMQTTPQQPQAQGTPIQRPSQRAQDQKQGFETPSVQPTQVKQQDPSINIQSFTGAQINKLVGNLPPTAQVKYQSLPEQNRRQFLFQYYQLRHQHQQQQQQRASMMMNSQTSGPRGMSSIPGQVMQPGRPQQHPSQQANTSMFGLKSDLSMIQQPGQTMQQQSLTGMPNPFMSQMQGQGPQFRDIMQNQGQFQNRAPTLNETQLRQMDTHPFPPGIFDTQLVGSRLPPEVKNWSQLKSWAAQNRHIVPNEVLQKLIGLQALHYHNIMQSKARDFRQAQAMASSTSTPQPGPAPQAQMTQMGNPQQPRPNGPNGNPLPMARMPQVPPFSRQEIQLFRQKLPDQVRNLPDEQVAQLIMRRRMALAQQSLNPPQPNHLNEQQRRLLDFQTNQSNQISLGQSTNQTTPSMQQNSRMPSSVLTLNRPAHNQPAQPGQQMMNQMPTTSQKNLKRSSTDDVIEVPNPNITQQDQRNQTIGKQGHMKQTLSQSENAAGKTGQNIQNHEGQYEAELRTQAALKDQPRGQQSKGTQDNPQTSQARSKFEDDAVRQRLHQITSEVVQMLKAQNRRPIAIDHATRQKLDKILKENHEVIKRSEESLAFFLRNMRDERLVRELVGTRILIMQQLQFHEDKSFTVKENLTISPEDFEKGISKLKQFCLYLMEFVKRKDRASASNKGPQALTGTSTPASMPPLNAANLQQNQQAELMKTQAARQQLSQTQKNNNRDNKAPAAPTSAQPPFSFLNVNGQSPHGVPVYGPNELTQDKLKFPPTKKRKGNPGSAVSTPVQAHAVPASVSSPKAAKMASPQVSQQAATPSKIKCQHADCVSSKREYATPEELHDHHGEVHEAKEPVIEDALAFFLESVRFGLGLDDNGKMKPKPKKGESEQSPAMKKSASAQGQTPLRQEGSTPMSRVSTQTGRPESGASKGSKAADFKVTSGTSVNSSSKGPMTPPDDPWSDCPVSMAEVCALLPSLEDLHSSLSTASFTPPSTISSSKSDKNSPKPSDIGEGDNLKIRLNVADSWVAPGLYDDALFPPSDPTIEEDELLGMDWDTVFGRKSTKKTDEWGGFNPNI